MTRIKSVYVPSANTQDITMDELRKELIDLCLSGKRPLVTFVVKEYYGVRKLSDIPKDKYPELLDLVRGNYKIKFLPVKKRYRWRPNKVLRFLCLLFFGLVIGFTFGAWLGLG